MPLSQPRAAKGHPSRPHEHWAWLMSSTLPAAHRHSAWDCYGQTQHAMRCGMQPGIFRLSSKDRQRKHDMKIKRLCWTWTTPWAWHRQAASISAWTVNERRRRRTGTSSENLPDIKLDLILTYLVSLASVPLPCKQQLLNINTTAVGQQRSLKSRAPLPKSKTC